MILPGTGRGTIRRRANGGGAATLRKPAVYVARKLRRAMSPPEVMLWQHLRSSKLGFKVRRQHPIGPYIADFIVSAARLVIEIDGRAHDFGDRPDRDVRRDTYLEEQGYGVVRIDAGAVRRDLDSVLLLIADRVANPLHHHASRDGPPPRAGEEL
jgi:very-short-patch-repair endonuclease